MIRSRRPLPGLAPGALLALGTLLLGGCAHSTAGPRPDDLEPGGVVITRSEIESYRVRDAYQVLLRARTHLNIQRTREGSEPRVTHRGVDSIVLSPQVLFVVDGTRVASVDHLKNIPSETLRHIQILSGREATPRFGAEGGNGAVLIWTNAG